MLENFFTLTWDYLTHHIINFLLLSLPCISGMNLFIILSTALGFFSESLCRHFKSVLNVLASHRWWTPEIITLEREEADSGSEFWSFRSTYNGLSSLL